MIISRLDLLINTIKYMSDTQLCNSAQGNCQQSQIYCLYTASYNYTTIVLCGSDNLLCVKIYYNLLAIIYTRCTIPPVPKIMF